jgi:hypothetical protein
MVSVSREIAPTGCGMVEVPVVEWRSCQPDGLSGQMAERLDLPLSTRVQHSYCGRDAGARFAPDLRRAVESAQETFASFLEHRRVCGNRILTARWTSSPRQVSGDVGGRRRAAKGAASSTSWAGTGLAASCTLRPTSRIMASGGPGSD